jgi:hypothetical protein
VKTASAEREERSRSGVALPHPALLAKLEAGRVDRFWVLEEPAVA